MPRTEMMDSKLRCVFVDDQGKPMKHSAQSELVSPLPPVRDTPLSTISLLSWRELFVHNYIFLCGQ